jgi:hypothetical protein
MEDYAMKKTSISMVSLAVVLLTFCVTATASQLFDKKTTITIPGDNYGVEFVYSKARALEVAKATNQHVMSATNPTTSTPAEQPTTAQVSQLQNETVAATTPQGTEVSPAEVHPPATTQTQAEPSQSVTQSSPSSTPIATVASNTPPLKTLP